MALSSSTSRQQRISMLPKPRPSSRISPTSRRVLVTSGDITSRIARRRVPSPLPLATTRNNSSGMITTADCNLSLPEAGLRRAGSPSARMMIPWSAGQNRTVTSPSDSESARPTPDPSHQSKTSSSFMSLSRTPSPEVKERPAGATRRPSRRLASVSTALTFTNTFSRVDNASPRDPSGGVGGGGLRALAWKKKSAFISSSSNSSHGGKENRRPRMYARVPPPPVAYAPTIPPRSNRRAIVAQPPSSRSASFRETPPPTRTRPLVIRKQVPLAAAAGSSPVIPASGVSAVSGALPVVGSESVTSAGIQTLIGDIGRFAKEWTEMFDEMSAGVEDPEDRLSKLDDASMIRIRPAGQPEETRPLHADNPAAAAAGKGTPRQLQPGPSESPASVSTLRASTLAGADAETVYFDVTPASLTRWQYRDKSLVKGAPEDKPVRDPNLLSRWLLTNILIITSGRRLTSGGLCFGNRSADGQSAPSLASPPTESSPSKRVSPIGDSSGVATTPASPRGERPTRLVATQTGK